MAFAHRPEWHFTLRRSNRPLKMAWEMIRRHSRHRALYRTQVRLAPELIHAHDVDTLPSAVQAKRRLGVPLIFDAHEVYDQRHVTNSAQEANRLRNSYLLAHYADELDGFVTLTPAIADYYRNTYPMLPAATIVANASPKLADSDYDGRLHAAAGLPPDVKILLYQGIYANNRGLAELVDCVAHLPAEWAVVTLGYGRLKEAMQARIRALDAAAQRRIRVLDAVPSVELPAWTRGASLGYLVLSNTHLSYWLASPNRLWAYPQSDIPILGTAFPELKRAVDRYGLGFVLAHEAPTAEAIAERVARLSEEDLARARAGCRAFMDAEGWHVHEQRLQALVTTLTRR